MATSVSNINHIPTFVIDTNVLIDYPDIIQYEKTPPEEPTIDLSNAHLVIPTIVIRELSKFKKEKSDRGKASRSVLRIIREILDGNVSTIEDAYNLKSSVNVPSSNQIISILPVHKNFYKSLPFRPSPDDMDGHIMVSAIAASLAISGKEVNGTLDEDAIKNTTFDNIVLLTNDNGLAIRARQRGISSERYGYKYQKPYTGRRDIVVPKELFYLFHNTQKIDRTDFENSMPKEPTLVANEFVVMSLEDENDYPKDFNPRNNPYFEHIGIYDRDKDAIIPLQYVKNFPIHLRNDGQAIYAEALMNPNFSAIVCTGPAGSGKTYLATIYGYEACKKGKFIGVTIVPCENRSNIGALPGDLDEKMDPDVQPIKNAIENFLLNEDKKFRKDLENLEKFGTGETGKSGPKSLLTTLKDRVDSIFSNCFANIPIEFARGRDFSRRLAIYDEFQDQNIAQADTLIKRLGNKGKIVLTGDIEQIHAPYLDQQNNGLVYASRLLFDNKMVAQVHFNEDEVIRHPLVKMVAERQKNKKENI